MNDADHTHGVDGAVVTWDLGGTSPAAPDDVAGLLGDLVEVGSRPGLSGSVVRLPTRVRSAATSWN